ncbi:zinc ribbon domain-containing protein [Flavobacterium filum]|uniref:zinc ribbon domain-containing protein n=1 Tax=Flavobacterium filum TaxID=370974 RepID=UPI0023EFA53D|nr:zinc ribbon domain-containing protein [Flavobacterium filum]
MFCKNCGQQIADNSRFCSHCGTLQKLPLNSTNPQQIVSPQTVQKLEGVFGIVISKQVVGYYLVWFLLHLILLLVNWKASDYANERFWPFSERSKLEHYDFSEFLLYTLVPLIILVIVNLFKDPKETRSEALQLKYDLTHEKDTTPTIIGIFIIIISMIYYFASGNSDSYDAEKAQQTRAILSVVSLILRIGITVWVVNIAKTLNRDTTGWGFFAFFLPSISLIVIGQKRKLKSQQQ